MHIIKIIIGTAVSGMAMLFAAPICTADGVEISEFMTKNESTLAAAGAYADRVESHSKFAAAADRPSELLHPVSFFRDTVMLSEGLVW